MNLTVFGIGYVGLVQAAVLAEVGHQVVCVDIDEKRSNGSTRALSRSSSLGSRVSSRRTTPPAASNSPPMPQAAVKHGQIQMIAVGTPPGEDGSADLKYVLAVAEAIGREMEAPKIVVGKSTVPVGTCEKIKAKIAETLKARGREDLDLRRRLQPGIPQGRFRGGRLHEAGPHHRRHLSEDTEAVMRELYAPFNRNHEKMIVMDVRSAEFTKYAANCMLATKISFMNEMANLAEQLGADIEEVRKGIGSDPRIGYHFIYPGLGYGGSCFPKDVRALIKTAEGVNFDAKLLRAVEERNNAQKSVLFDKVNRYFKGNLKGKTFALWGLAFKPNTDDMREAPARKLDGGAVAGGRQGAGLRSRGDAGMPEPSMASATICCSAAPRRRLCAAPTR